MSISITLEYLNHALEAFRRGDMEKAYGYLLVAQGAERARVEWEAKKTRYGKSKRV